MKIHIAAPAVIRGEMENGVDALHGRPRHTGFPQIGLQKIDLARAEILANVAEMAAGQVIDDANFFRASRQQLIRKRRPDERRSTRHKNSLARPKSVRRRHACVASLTFESAVRRSKISANFCNSLTLS